jgi:tyrosine-protein kinase Etk/Wzc
MIANNETNNLEIQEDTSEINLREVLYKYIRHWRWFLFSLIFFTGLGYMYIKLSEPLYKIETDLLIKDNKGTLDGQNDLLKNLDLFSSDKIIDNEVQILKSNSILEKVIRGLNLQTSYYSTKGVRKHEAYENLPYKFELLQPKKNADFSTIYNVRLLNDHEAEINGKKYPLNKPFNLEVGLVAISLNNTPTQDPALGKTSMEITFSDVDDVIDRVSKKISINPVSKQATVLIITMEDALPARGRDVLNRLVFEYNKAAIDDKNQVTSSTLAFIKDRLEKLQEELGTSEKKVEDFKSVNKITDISSQSQIFLQMVQDNDAQVNKVNIQLSILSNLEKYLHSVRNSQVQVPSMLGIEDATLLGLVNQLYEAQSKRLSLLQTTPETNPIVTTINDQIEQLKASISQSVQNLKSGLEITKQQLDKKNASFQSVIEQVPSKERGLIDVMRQQEIKNNLFTYLLQKREETEISLASTSADSRTIDAARSTKYPIKPVKKVTFLLFFILGLVIPTLIIYIRDLLNFKISKKSDIEKVTKAPIIAEISHSYDSSALLVVSKPRSMVAEQLRALRTNLSFIIPGANQKNYFVYIKY